MSTAIVHWGRGTIGRIIIMLTLLIFVSAFPVMAETDETSTADRTDSNDSLVVPTAIEAVYLALNHSAAMKNARLQLEETVVGHEAAVAGLTGWRLDANVNNQYTHDPRSLPSRGFPESEEVNTLAATLSLRKSLFPGAQTRATLHESGLSVALGERAFSRTVTETIVETYDAYRQLELLLLRHELSRRSVDIAQKGWETAKDRQQTGALAEVEAEEARLNYVEAVHQHTAARQFLDVAWRRLAYLIGVDPEQYSIDDLPVTSLEELSQMMAEEGGIFSPAAPWPEDKTVDHMIRQALTQRSEIEDARTFVTLSDIAAEKVRLDSRPTFQLSASYTDTDHSTALSLDDEWVLTATATKLFFSEEQQFFMEEPGQTPIPFDPDPSWEISVGVTFNLWDAHATSKSLQKAEKARQQAETALAQAEEGIELDVLRLHAQLASDFDSLRLATERAQLTQAQWDIEKERLDLGMSTALLVDQAALRHFAAVIEAVSRRFSYETSILELARGIGFEAEELLQLTENVQRW